MFTIIVLLFTAFSSPEVEATPAPPAAPVIEWLTFEEAIERNKTEPRKWMVDVYTDWCGWCKRMDATTFKNPEIAKAIAANYYAVKLDGERKEDIEINGQVMKFVANGRRGYHELPAKLMNGKMSYPTLVFIDENLQVIQPLPGYRNAKELLPILTYLGENHYKSIDFESYVKKLETEQTGN